MPSRDQAVEQAERVRAAITALGCSRSEAVALVVLLAGACAALALLWHASRPAEGPEPRAAAVEASESAPADSPPNPPSASAPASAPSTNAQADAPPAQGPVVHVSGLVARPGVYDLPAGGRVADALEAAGGALAGARLDGLNLARMVADGEQVHVPGPDDEVLPPAGPPAASAWLPDGRLDINRADVADFEELPGIGPVLAERIVSHREELGRFESIGDLLGVRGIGERTLAALADLLAL